MYEESKWKQITAVLNFAFQPVVNVNTGVCIGVEALLRGYEQAGFENIKKVFDSAHSNNYLLKLNDFLREKAIEKFQQIPFYNKIRLFYNVDYRMYFSENNSLQNSNIKNNLHNSKALIFDFKASDINENQEGLSYLKHFRENDIKISIDDYGTGKISLELLYKFQPDYVKIDKFFIDNIAHDHKKRMFTTKILNLAQLFSKIVIAECVSTNEDFLMCKEIGFDYVQGNIIQQAVLDINELNFQYRHIVKLVERSHRSSNSDHRLIHEQLEYISPIIAKKTKMSEVFDLFKANENVTYFPVIDDDMEPLGIIREKDLKKYVYSKFGKEILVNQTIGKTVKHFISECPITEIYKSIEKILAIYSMDEYTEGIILTANGKYLGMLSANSLLKALHEKNLSEARDSNPLTKLPGNNSINEYLAESYYDFENDYVYIYFDFDNFKPFNDKYGFRVGDRAILLFADLLRLKIGRDFFIGHVGGDDFFAGIKLGDTKPDLAIKEVKDMCKKFSEDILPFLSEDDRINGFIVSKSRSGRKKKFPLLSVSAAILHITRYRDNIPFEQLSSEIAGLKKKAKSVQEKYAVKKI